jgi:hypothetical protein
MTALPTVTLTDNERVTLAVFNGRYCRGSGVAQAALETMVTEIITARLNESGQYTDPSADGCAHPNCEQHVKGRCEGVRCDGSVRPSGQWAELLGPLRVEDYEMVERRVVRLGDHVYSSHWGADQVIEVIPAGTHGQTIELRFEPKRDHEGREYIRNERYDADSDIPRRRPGH